MYFICFVRIYGYRKNIIPLCAYGSDLGNNDSNIRYMIGESSNLYSKKLHM